MYCLLICLMHSVSTYNRYYGNGENKDVFSLMRKKGVYPYEYMSKWSRFKKTNLPLKEKFYSTLNLQDISDADYEHAKKVWRVMGIKDMGGVSRCSILRQMCCCWLMYLRTLEIPV